MQMGGDRTHRNASLFKQSASWMSSSACFLNAALTQCRTSKMWCSFGLCPPPRQNPNHERKGREGLVRTAMAGSAARG